jgi:hypothetical protein
MSLGRMRPFLDFLGERGEGIGFEPDMLLPLPDVLPLCAYYGNTQK